MSSVSLYRKYRSQTFEELVGQEPVVKTLKNAIATGRIGHAYLFTGPRGVGKTSAARLLARAANCLSTTLEKPCNECSNCLAAGREIATDLIEIDAASNTGVDNIREVIERAQFSPSVWHTKFYIIDEVHMLSVSAFNALLKTLEEPPPHVAFILATTEVHKVPATVASRCQRFDFRRVPLRAMVDRLRWICDQEGIVAEDAALELVARQATGSLRDALSLMDQLRVFSEGGVTLTEVQDMLGASGSEKVADFVDCLLSSDLAAGLRLINSIADDGLDIRQFNRQIVEHLRSLMLVKSGAAQGDTGLIDVTEEIRQRMNGQAAQTSIPDLLHWIRAFSEADANLRTTSYRQLPLELALVECLTKPAADPATGQLGQAPELSARPTPLRPSADGPPPVTRHAAQPPSEAPQPMSRQHPRQPQETHAPIPPPISAELPTANSTFHSPQVAVSSVQPQITNPPDIEALNAGIPPIEEFSGGNDDAEYGDVDQLARLRRLWPHLLEQINARSKQMAAVFRDANQVRPYKVENRVVTISFLRPFHAGRARGEPQRTLLEQALSRTLGHPCIVETITFDQEGHEADEEGSAVPPNGPKDHGPKSPAPHETPRGRAAMNIFGIEKFED